MSSHFMYELIKDIRRELRVGHLMSSVSTISTFNGAEIVEDINEPKLEESVYVSFCGADFVIVYSGTQEAHIDPTIQAISYKQFDPIIFQSSIGECGVLGLNRAIFDKQYNPNDGYIDIVMQSTNEHGMSVYTKFNNCSKVFSESTLSVDSIVLEATDYYTFISIDNMVPGFSDDYRRATSEQTL